MPPAPFLSILATVQHSRVCPRCRKINPLEAATCSDCGGGLEHRQIFLPPEPVVYAPVEGLACPACKREMEAAEAFVDSSPWLGLEQRISSTLYVRFPGVPNRTRVMRLRQERPAARCRNCGGVWIAPRIKDSEESV